MTAIALLGRDLPGWVGAALAVVALGVVAGLLVRLRAVGRDHARTVQELQHSTLQVTAIVDSALDAIIAMDQLGRIIRWNPEAERLLGWKAEEVDGRLVSKTIIPERHRRDHEKGLARLLETGEGRAMGRVMEVSALCRDGREVPVDLRITQGMREGDQATFVAFIRDVSARQRAERIQGLRFVVAGVLSQARTPADATQGVLTAVGTRLRAPLAALWEPALGGLRSEQHWAADPSASAAVIEATRTITIAVGTGLPGRVWASSRPLTVEEVSAGVEDFQRLRLAHQAGLRHAVAVPVSSGEKTLAVLEVFVTSREEIDEETLRTLDDIGGQLGQYLARRRAELLQDSPERLQSLLESAADALITVADDGAITSLNERARAMFGYSSLEVIGEDLRVLIAEDDRDQVIEYVGECLDNAQGGAVVRRWLDLTGRRRDDGRFTLSLHITPLVVGGRQVFMCLCSELAEIRVYRPATQGDQRPQLA